MYIKQERDREREIYKKKMNESEHFFDTYNPLVVKEYKSALNDPEYYSTAVEGIENWVEKCGKDVFGRHSGISDNMIIEVRYYSDINGSAKKHSLPSDCPAHMKQFLRDHKAVDIVCVLGYSLIGKTRREISEMGLEFYLITKEVETGLEVKPEYHPDRLVIMKKYANDVFKKIYKLLAKEISNLKGERAVAKLYRDLKSYLEILFSNVLVNSKVKSKINGNVYTSNEILKMFQMSVGNVLGGQEGFKNNIVNGMMDSIGIELTNQMKNLPSYIIKKNEDSEHELANNEIEDIVHQKITSEVGSIHIDCFEDFVGFCNGNLKSQIGSNVNTPKKKKKKKNKWKEMFKSAMYGNIKHKCYDCHTENCEDKKFSKVGGSITEFSNNIGTCPFTLFKNKENEDVVFSQKIMKLKSSLDEKKLDGMQIAVIISQDKFDPQKHLLFKHNIKLDENTGETKMITQVVKDNVKPTEYKVIGNKLCCGEKDANIIEYADPRLPNVLFLIET
jgi:hypothetical protein